MVVVLVYEIRGEETRERLVIDYANVAVWTNRNVFERRSEWLFAFEETAQEYNVVLCDTEYVLIQNGEISVNIDGSGYRTWTVGQLSLRLAEKSS